MGVIIRNGIEYSGSGSSASNIVYLTQAEYDALPDTKYTDSVEYRITDTGVRGSAENISYDNSASGLDAKNVQVAVDKLNDSLTEQPTFVYDETGKITGYTTKIGGADTVFPFSSSDVIGGTVTTSANSLVKVTLGFKPKLIAMYSTRLMAIYSEELTKILRFTTNGFTEYSQSTSNVNIIATVDDDGFTMGKASNDANAHTITYFAVS